MDKQLTKRGHEKYGHGVLSDLMVAVLLFVKHWINEKGYAPLFSDIEAYTDIHKNTVQHCIEALVKYGYIKWIYSRGRGFDLTYEGRSFIDPRPNGKRNLQYRHTELNDAPYSVMIAINRLMSSNRVPPTEREIMLELGLTNTTGIHRQIHALRDKGYLVDNTDQPKGKRVIIQTAKGLRLGEGNEATTQS